MSVIRYAIVDNDIYALRGVRSGLSRVLTSSYQCVWSVCSGEEAISYSTSADAPDIVLVDMSMKPIDGVKVIQEIRESNQSIVLIGMTSYHLNLYADAVAQAGAQALVLKSNIRSVAQAMHSGEVPYGCPEWKAGQAIFYSPQQSFERLNKESIDNSALTVKEEKIMKLCIHGATAREVADLLGLQVSTVNTHLQRIYKKLHVQNRIEALNIYRGYKVPTDHSVGS